MRHNVFKFAAGAGLSSLVVFSGAALATTRIIYPPPLYQPSVSLPAQDSTPEGMAGYDCSRVGYGANRYLGQHLPVFSNAAGAIRYIVFVAYGEISVRPAME